MPKLTLWITSPVRRWQDGVNTPRNLARTVYICQVPIPDATNSELGIGQCTAQLLQHCPYNGPGFVVNVHYQTPYSVGILFRHCPIWNN